MKQTLQQFRHLMVFALLPFFADSVYAQKFDYGDAPMSYSMNANGDYRPPRSLRLSDAYQPPSTRARLVYIAPAALPTPGTAYPSGNNSGPAPVATGVSNNLFIDGESSVDTTLQIVRGAPFSITVRVYNVYDTYYTNYYTPYTKRLRAWIDFDNDGLFEGAEYTQSGVISAVLQSPTANGELVTLTWTGAQTANIPYDAKALYVRLRLNGRNDINDNNSGFLGGSSAAGINDPGAIGDAAGSNGEYTAYTLDDTYASHFVVYEGEIEDSRLPVMQPSPFNPYDNRLIRTVNNNFQALTSSGSTFGSTPLFTLTGGSINAIGYNVKDNLIYGVDVNTNQIVQIGANGVMKKYTVPHLDNPSGQSYNAGDVDTAGYLYLSPNDNQKIFVTIDVDSTRPTFMKVVDPLNGFTESVAQYYTDIDITVNGLLSISDWAFNPQDDCLYAIVDGLSNGGIKYAIYKVLPRQRSQSPVPKASAEFLYSKKDVTGFGIQNNDAFGGQFFDNAGNLYVYGNTNGFVYRIQISDANLVASRMTNNPSGSTVPIDGASNSLTSSPLPVSLVAFDAKVKGKSVVLDWKTAMEYNNKGFEIERSVDGDSWSGLSFVAAQGSRNGAEYSYTDAFPLTYTSFYRLKQSDYDGNFEYSPVRRVQFSVDQLTVYPSFVSDELIVSGLQGGEQIRIYNVAGALIVEQTAVAASVTISLEQQSEGIYYVNIVDEGKVVSVHKIVKGK